VHVSHWSPPFSIFFPSAVSLSFLKRSWFIRGQYFFLVIGFSWYLLLGFVHPDGFCVLKDLFIKTNHIERFTTPLEGHSGPIYFYLIVLLIGFMPWSVFVLWPPSRCHIGTLRAGVSVFSPLYPVLDGYLCLLLHRRNQTAQLYLSGPARYSHAHRNAFVTRREKRGEICLVSCYVFCGTPDPGTGHTLPGLPQIVYPSFADARQIRPSRPLFWHSPFNFRIVRIFPDVIMTAQPFSYIRKPDENNNCTFHGLSDHVVCCHRRSFLYYFTHLRWTNQSASHPSRRTGGRQDPRKTVDCHARGLEPASVNF